MADHPQIGADFWSLAKQQHPVSLAMVYMTQGLVDQLNAKQRLFYDMIRPHYLQKLDGASPPPLLIHLDGHAGTGKSHVIGMLSAHLAQLVAQQTPPCLDPVLRAASTGVAAHGISGRTLHSLFRLPPKAIWAQLSVTQLHSMRALVKGFHYLVIDEKSMLGLESLEPVSYTHLTLPTKRIV